MNALHLIVPYRHNGMWVFDDDRVNLFQEPFVAGIDKMIDILVKDIPNAENGFNLIFSDSPFPGYDIVLEWKSSEYEGNWYYCSKYDITGWLCPALFLYYETAPKNIYVKAQ